MPTQQEIIDQQNATITKLTALNKTLEDKYLAVCRENDQLKGNALIDKRVIKEMEVDLQVLLGRLEQNSSLIEGLAKGMEVKGE